MEEHTQKNQLVLEQWEHFQRNEPVDESIVRPLILRSWKRCKQLYVNPETGNRCTATAQQKEDSIRRNAELLEVSRGIMEKLYNPISTSGSIISLSDSNGIVLHALWDDTGNYPVPNIVSGSIAAESSSGTNAIGTCLVEKISVETLGAEHYCRTLHDWFCSSTPIPGLKNELVGVLNVTLPLKYYHHHTRGMIESAAYAISEQLRLRLLLAEQKAVFEMLDEGVVIIDNDGWIKSSNTQAKKMLGIADAETADYLPTSAPTASNPAQNIKEILLSPDILRAIFSESAHFDDQEALLNLHRGALNCMLSVSRIEGEKGRVLTLRESKKVKDSAVRVTGAKAVYTFNHIIGHSPAMEKTIHLARVAAQSDATTLILGESGTGKELFAQSVHNASKRANGPFIVVNCGALPRNLVQSELFGYDEGSFTGASRLGKPGKFELADGGSIFLDEIGEMPLEAQVSLLRLLQNGEVTRVGGKYTRYVNVRVIAATNRNLELAIQEHSFREDLFYRLNVFPLNIPPLRERDSDIKLLIEYFLHHFSLTLHKKTLKISDAAMTAFCKYSWPGNIRELENMLERMAHMASDSGVIDLNIVPSSILQATENSCGKKKEKGLLSSQEKESILATLAECDGNIRAAARLLGVSRSGLYVKMKRFQILPDQCRMKEE